MPGNTKKIEHNGIKAELIGQIELAYCWKFTKKKIVTIVECKNYISKL